MISGLVLALSLCLILSGCGREEVKEEEPGFELYYVNSSETGLYKVPYTLTGSGTEEMVDEVTEALKNQSDKLLYKTVIDNIFMIESVSINEGQLILGFSEEYRNTDPLLEVLARASIVRSYGQIPGIDGVSFTVGGEPLSDSAGNLIGVMVPEQFITNAGKEINAYEKAKLNLYFADDTGEKLVMTSRSVVYNTNIPLEKLVVDEIIKGAEEGTMSYSTLNPAAKAVSVTVTDGTCYVNMDPAYLTVTYPVTDDVIVYSIANSLIELDGINKVQISVDEGGSAKESPLTGIFERNLDIVE